MSAGSKVVAHYKQGPNGRVADHNADYLATYGPCTIPKHVDLGSGCQDRRDSRDPSEVGQAIVDRRDIEKRIADAMDAAGYWRLTPADDEDAKLFRRHFNRAVFTGDYVTGRGSIVN